MQISDLPSSFLYLSCPSEQTSRFYRQASCIGSLSDLLYVALFVVKGRTLNHAVRIDVDVLQVSAVALSQGVHAQIAPRVGGRP